MKKLLIITLILAIIGLLYWLYKKYLYFPHAKVLSRTSKGFTWTNGENIISSTISTSDATNHGGTYGNGYEYGVTTLPNNQVRFVISKKGTVIVDNIISILSPPIYLTK